MSKYPDFPSIPFTLKKAKESNACLNILISHQFLPLAQLQTVTLTKTRCLFTKKI